MPNKTGQKHLVHRGLTTQLPIYLGKLLRGFLYQSDWKVLPMSAVIAGIMTIVVRNAFGVTEEGTLLGAFGMACVGVWNGTFNSIQVICRERDIIKREHRSGLKIFSYVASHMVYQALLCLAQTAITLFVALKLGMKFPASGVIFSHAVVELGITLFITSFASDMLSLFVSALVKNTTAAMTVMPFILIFQLVFAGGFFQLPEEVKHMSKYTISSYALRSVNATMRYNELPSAMAWNAVAKMRDQEISGTVTLGEALDLVGENGSSLFRPVREITYTVTAKEIEQKLLESIPDAEIRAAAAVAFEENIPADTAFSVNLGEIIDAVTSLEDVQNARDLSYDFKFTVKQLMDVFTEQKVKDLLETAGSRAAYNPQYDSTEENVRSCWESLILMACVFAAVAMVNLSFIDKDRR